MKEPHNVGMYGGRIPKRSSPPAYLLRESYREGGKVENRTLANLSHLPIEQRLAKHHLKDGALVLYDVRSSSYEGHTYPPARYGHNRFSTR